MKKKAVTLAELIICLAIIGGVYLIVMPIIKSNAPKSDVVMLRKAYNTVEKTIHGMIFDDYAYGDAELGFANTTATAQSGGTNKFCYYFFDSLNVHGLSADGCSAKTSDGIAWAISDVSFPTDGSYVTTITADVNGSKSPNCEYSASCKAPDTFSVKVRYDGKINLEDEYVINLLENPMKNN